ncbi:sterol carrier protein domain-containing protein, partial [Pseudonocardia sp. ICBG601]|uniref:sterol carrier protein domain-containing protein n=1 Tax=Pseudonocardia sp. ICBG601 TaxID=2846759 RepID=UPI0035ABFAB6
MAVPDRSRPGRCGDRLGTPARRGPRPDADRLPGPPGHRARRRPVAAPARPGRGAECPHLGAGRPVVLRVHDAFLGDGGTWRLAGGAAEPAADADPDLECTVDALSAAFLGGRSPSSLVARGRWSERTPERRSARTRCSRCPARPRGVARSSERGGRPGSGGSCPAGDPTRPDPAAPAGGRG